MSLFPWPPAHSNSAGETNPVLVLILNLFYFFLIIILSGSKEKQKQFPSSADSWGEPHTNE